MIVLGKLLNVNMKEQGFYSQLSEIALKQEKDKESVSIVESGLI